MNKYHIQSALIFSSTLNARKETEHILKELDEGLYALVRSDPKDYLKEEYLRFLDGILGGHIVGMKINSSLEKYRVTDPIYQGVLEILQDHEAVLLLHCGRWVEMSGWQYGVEVAKKYPKLKVILAHMGGTHPDLSFPAIEAIQDMKNVYMDTSQTRQLAVFRKGLNTLGSSRILFGTDLPWGSYLQNLTGLLELELDEKYLDDILRKNFQKLIGR